MVNGKTREILSFCCKFDTNDGANAKLFDCKIDYSLIGD